MSHFIGIGIFWIRLNGTDHGCWRLSSSTQQTLRAYDSLYMQEIFKWVLLCSSEATFSIRIKLSAPGQ